MITFVGIRLYDLLKIDGVYLVRKNTNVKVKLVCKDGLFFRRTTDRLDLAYDQLVKYDSNEFRLFSEYHLLMYKGKNLLLNRLNPVDLLLGISLETSLEELLLESK